MVLILGPKNEKEATMAKYLDRKYGGDIVKKPENDGLRLYLGDERNLYNRDQVIIVEIPEKAIVLDYK